MAVDCLANILAVFIVNRDAAVSCLVGKLSLTKKKRKKARKKPNKARRPVLASRLGKTIRTGLLISLLVSLLGLFVLDGQLTRRFSGSKWALPSHVYSRAFELYEGLELSQGALVWELEKLGYRRVTKVSAAGQYGLKGQHVDGWGNTGNGARRKPPN